MRHLHTGRKLGVSPHHRKALLRNLTLALIEKETIQTTPARAKETRWFAERIVTLAKRGDVANRRHIVKLLGSTVTNVPGENRVRNAVDKVYTVLVPRFKGRNGGYTQILRLAMRRAGDNAEMCVMRYLPSLDDAKKGGSAKDKAQKPAKKAAAAPQDKAAKVKAKADHDHKHDHKPEKKEPQDKAHKKAPKGDKE